MLMSELNNDLTTNESTPRYSEELGFDDTKVKEMLIKDHVQGGSRRKKVVGIIIFLVILAAAGFGLKQWAGSSQDVSYSTTAIGQATISDSIEATGTLSPVKQSSMGFKNDDTITAINVQPGDHVKAGQILAQQDPNSLQSALQQAQSSVEQDQLSIQNYELTLENNLKTFDRQQKLFSAGAIPQSDLDTAQNNYTKSKIDLATAKSKLANDQTKAAQAQSDLSGATLVAPFDGIIGIVNGQVGQINGINSSTSTLLTIMSTELQLTALVNEADIGRIKVGQEVEFSSSSYSNKKFKGQVLRITPQASTVSNVQYYPVLISCNDPDGQLMSGMSVTADIIIAQKSNVLTVPMMAVSYAQTYLKSHPTEASQNRSQSAGVKGSQGRTTPTQKPPAQKMAGSGSAGSAGQPAVVLTMNNKKISVKHVLLGLDDGSNYEVIQGLSEGEQVVVGSDQLDTQTQTTNSNSNKSNSYRRNQGGGSGMGGPPPGM